MTEICTPSCDVVWIGADSASSIKWGRATLAVIVAVYVILDDLLRAMEHRTDPRARTSDSDTAQRTTVTVGVIAACQFQNHHERALCVLKGLGYLSGPLSVSRFNHRFHALAHRLSDVVDLLATLLTAGTLFIIDSMPLPVCRRARAWRCRKVQGAEYCGYCAAKKEKLFDQRVSSVTCSGILHPQGVTLIV